MAGRSLLDVAQRRFLGSARTATLATIAADGRPRLVPVCFVVGDDERAGTPAIFSPLDEKPKASSDPRDLARVRDVVARPVATLLVDRWSEHWDRLGWIRLDCRAGLVEPDAPGHAGAIGALRAKYPQYRTHRLEDRPMLRFMVERVAAWGNISVDAERS